MAIHRRRRRARAPASGCAGLAVVPGVLLVGLPAAPPARRTARRPRRGRRSGPGPWPRRSLRRRRPPPAPARSPRVGTRGATPSRSSGPAPPPPRSRSPVRRTRCRWPRPLPPGRGWRPPGGSCGGCPGAVRHVERELELAQQLLAGLVPVRRVLRHGPGHHGVDRRGELGADARDRRRRLDQVRPQQGGVVVPAEGQLPGQALVEHAAQRVDVRAGPHRPALDLLGRRRSRRCRGSARCRSGPPDSSDVRLVSPKSVR